MLEKSRMQEIYHALTNRFEVRPPHDRMLDIKFMEGAVFIATVFLDSPQLPAYLTEPGLCHQLVAIVEEAYAHRFVLS